MLAASLVGAKGAVLAFEPEPTSFTALSRSVALNGLSNVRCINLAPSDRAGSMAFHWTFSNERTFCFAILPGMNSARSSFYEETGWRRLSEFVRTRPSQFGSRRKRRGTYE
jgi:FkbM family methyltransferase